MLKITLAIVAALLVAQAAASRTVTVTKTDMSSSTQNTVYNIVQKGLDIYERGSSTDYGSLSTYVKNELENYYGQKNVWSVVSGTKFGFQAGYDSGYAIMFRVSVSSMVDNISMSIWRKY